MPNVSSLRVLVRLSSAAALLLAPALAGCSIGQGQPCAAVYLSSGVTFDLSAVVDPAAGGTVRLCIGDRCEDWDVAHHDLSAVFLSIESPGAASSLSVEARVVDANGATTFDGSGTADLQHYPPDGPVCQEDLYRSTVRADMNGTLTTIT